MQKTLRSSAFSAFGLGFALVALALIGGGCTTTGEETRNDAELIPDYRPVGMKQVTGADGEVLGWIRTDSVATEGTTDGAGTYEVLLDRDMKPIGYQPLSGRYYRAERAIGAESTRLAPVGVHGRGQAMAHFYDTRAADAVVEDVSHRQLAASGTLSRAAQPIKLGGGSDADDMDDGAEDEDDDEE